MILMNACVLAYVYNLPHAKLIYILVVVSINLFANMRYLLIACRIVYSKFITTFLVVELVHNAHLSFKLLF